MKTLSQWLEEYAESHQNSTNILIHKICVPIIFWSIYLMLFSIPFPKDRSMYFNSANIVYVLALFFWFRLSIKVGIFFLLHGLILGLVSMIIWTAIFQNLDVPLFRISLIMLILAWIGQLIGHKIEGKKPSFLKDIQFLLIGPVWIVKKWVG